MWDEDESDPGSDMIRLYVLTVLDYELIYTQTRIQRDSRCLSPPAVARCEQV